MNLIKFKRYMSEDKILNKLLLYEKINKRVINDEQYICQAKG